MQAAIGVPLVHLAEVTVAAVRAANVTTAGLRGPAYVMEQPFYREGLEAAGLTVLVPDAADRALVHRAIFEGLCVGEVNDSSRRDYLGVVDRLVGARLRGRDPRLDRDRAAAHRERLSGASLPTTRLHVEAAVAAVLADPA